VVEEYRSLSSSLWCFLYTCVTSSLLRPNILLNTLFSLWRVSARNCSPHRVVLQLYKREELRGLSLAIEVQVYNFLIITNNGIINCLSIKLLKETGCGVLVTYKIWVVVTLHNGLSTRVIHNLNIYKYASRIRLISAVNYIACIKMKISWFTGVL
jgi:hypothetical protein